MLAALILTIILECLALFLIGEREKLYYIYWIAITSVTNLSANLYLALVFKGGNIEYWLTVAVVELLVSALEFVLSFIYTNNWKKSIKNSLICNLSSFLIGLIIF
jgi:hypothetical protein